MAKEKTNLYLLAIVAIVAVVGIVVLVLNAGTGSLSYLSDVSSEDSTVDLSGQAINVPSGGTNCCHWYCAGTGVASCTSSSSRCTPIQQPMCR